MLRLRRHAACSRSPERSVVVLLCHGRLCWLRCVLCRYDVRVLLTALCFQNRMAFKSRQTLRPPSLLTLIQAVSQQEQQQQQLTHTLTHSHTHTLTHSLTHTHSHTLTHSHTHSHTHTHTLTHSHTSTWMIDRQRANNSQGAGAPGLVVLLDFSQVH